MKPYPVPVGALIRIELERQQLTVTWLAEKLRIQRPNCYRLLRAASVQTETLFRVSQVLKHDFFCRLLGATNTPY